MIKNIYIGDTHGRDIWSQIVKEHEDADNIVFVGDYFDSFDIDGFTQLRNAQDIVDFKKFQELDPSKKVYLLIGNHDIHYWPGVKDRGTTSGFQSTMMFQFEQFFRKNENMFQMAVCLGATINRRLCTHAGVSAEFLKDVGYWTYNYEDYSHVADFLNELFKHKPNEFTFNSYADKVMGYVDGYGDNEGQSPVWIRPKSLQRSNKNEDIKKMYVQIVGHTQQKNLDITGKTTGGKYYYIDTLSNGEYLIEMDGIFSVGKVIEQYSLDNVLVHEFESICNAAKQLNISKSGIIRCCKGKQKSVGILFLNTKNMSDFLNWELTNRMHNLGYDGKTLMYIDDEGDIINDDSAELIGAKPAILTSAAFRWFREKYELTWEHSFDDSQIQLYVGEIAYPDNCLDFFKSIEVKYDCYNKAFEEAELACLDKLIEIVEQKQT